MTSGVVPSMVLFAILTLTATTCSATQGESHTRTLPEDHGSLREPVELALQDYMGVLVTLEVGVGEETLPFLFDTGSGLTMITPELADRLGLQTFGRVTGFRMDGGRVDLARCQETRFGVGSVDIEIEPVVFDLMRLIPQGWPEVGGVVSLHTFQNHAITLDLGGSRLILETEASKLSRTDTMHRLSVRFPRQASGSSVDLMAEAAAKTGTMWLEVDTGNTGPVRLAPHALQQLGAPEDSAGGPWAGAIDLDIAGLGSVDVAAVEADLIYDGVLNIDTIRKMILTVDFPGRQAWAVLR